MGWGSSRLFHAYAGIGWQVALGAKLECGGGAWGEASICPNSGKVDCNLSDKWTDGIFSHQLDPLICGASHIFI